MKYFNAAANLISYSGSVLFRQPFVIGMPVAAGIELTNYCNLRCPECLTGSGQMTRKKGYMDNRLFEKIIRELKPFMFNLNLYFQGESMMHDGFFEFVKMAAGINTTVSTNGHFLDKDNAGKLASSELSKLIVSLDGMNEHSYSQYRKQGDFIKVTDGIENVSDAIKKYKSGLTLEIQFLVNRFNEKEIPEALRFARKVDAKLRLKSMQVMAPGKAEEWMPASKKFRRYLLNNGIVKIKNNLPDRCFRLWTSPVITWDGKVVPCCFDKDADRVMGDLNESTFRDIWHSDRYNEFRKMILEDRGGIEICRNCTSGLRGVRY